MHLFLPTLHGFSNCPWSYEFFSLWKEITCAPFLLSLPTQKHSSAWFLIVLSVDSSPLKSRYLNLHKNFDLVSLLLMTKSKKWLYHLISLFRFKDNALIDMSQDPRVSITTRPWGSRLRIKDVFTVDTGMYRCEASNEFRIVETSAYLYVAFGKRCWL